jgi:hypothetical protein
MNISSPALLDLLTKQDQMEYIHIQETFSKIKWDEGRNRLTEMFGQIITTVKAFVMKKR